MPVLSDITYSREATIAAVRDYYTFLTKLYLPETEVIEPPEGGWPSVNSESLHWKSNEVIALLRHLPYIRNEIETQGAPYCRFANWQRDCHLVLEGQLDWEDLKLTSEDPEYLDDTPPQVIGLTSGGRYNPTFLLDTQLGIVYWVECPTKIEHHSTRGRICDDSNGYENMREAEWRRSNPAWAIPDFFQVLKDQFCELNFFPVSPLLVEDVYTGRQPYDEDTMRMLQRIYREHGWPDLQQYRKRDCLLAVRAKLKERDPCWSNRCDDD